MSNITIYQIFHHLPTKRPYLRTHWSNCSKKIFHCPWHEHSVYCQCLIFNLNRFPLSQDCVTEGTRDHDFPSFCCFIFCTFQRLHLFSLKLKKTKKTFFSKFQMEYLLDVLTSLSLETKLDLSLQIFDLHL